MKIGTHNSVTGEKSRNILYSLLTPFSKCQSKNIEELYKAGCRYFDIRVKKVKDKWKCAHGIWESKRTAEDILSLINSYKDCFIRLVYEGKGSNDFLNTVDNWIEVYKNITFTTINIKKPIWQCIKVCNNIPMQERFIILDGRSWHTYIPIPWLWKKIYYNEPQFNNDYYTNVDFL